MPSNGRKKNKAYRSREHLTETEFDSLLDALKRNRHGHRDRLIGLLIFRHGLRVSEACELRWDDLDLTTNTIIVRRLKGSTDSTHFLERDEVNGLRALQRQQAADGIQSPFVFINERRAPFNRDGINKMIKRAGKVAGLPFQVHVHMLRHSTGHALATRGMDTRRLQHYLGHASITNTVRYTAMSPEPFKNYEPSTRSVRLHGVTTSIRLETLFWHVLDEIGRRDGLSVNRLITKLYDEIVEARGEVRNFASFLRVCSMRYLSLQVSGSIPSDLSVPIRSLNADAVLTKERSASGLLTPPLRLSPRAASNIGMS
jgi:predicted DNA-binding ribbon-helix-helix protein